MKNFRTDLTPIEFAFSKISEGYAYCKIVTDDKGEPIDWVYVDVNDAYERINGVKKADVVGKKATEVLPNIRRDPGDWLGIYGQVALTGQPIVTERYAEVRKKWYHVSAYSPQKGYFAAIFEDITARKKAEESIKKSEERFSKAFNLSPVATIITRLADGCYIDVNDNFERIFGYSKHEVIGHTSSELNIFADAGGRNAFLGLLQEKGKLRNHEMTFRAKTSQLVPCIISTEKISLNEQEHLLTTLVDITDRKQAESALRESERRWSTTLSSIGDAVIATDTEGRITFLNPVAEHLTGWTLQEAKGKPVKEVFNIVNEHTRAEVESPVTKVLQLGLIVGLANHTVLIRKDGSEVPIDDSGAPIVAEDGAIRGVVLVFRDITERKKAEQAIIDSEERLKRTQEIAHLGSWELDLKEDTLTWSDEVYRIFGLKPQQLIATYEAFLSFVHPDDRAAVDSAYSTSIREGKEGYEIEHRIVRKDSGEIRIVHEKCTHIRDQKGLIIKSIGMVHDITERKKAEQEIARLASYPTLNPNPVIELDSNGKVIYANPATKSLFPTLEAEGLNHLFFNNWESVKKTFSDRGILTFSRDVKINNHWYQQQLYRVPETLQIRIYTTDIDELKQTELARAKAQIKVEEYANQMEKLAEQRAHQLKNAERLAAIGQTAGMVGHDIRNPLQAITGDMYLIGEEIKDMAEGDSKQAILESIESVNRNLIYINKIVSDLQDYTRPLRPNLQDANLWELVEGTLATITIPKGIEVFTDIAASAKPIKTDPAFMRRMLTNLVTNAIQAMQEEGKLTIKACKNQNATILTIHDTGIGIPDEVKAKMFTPLFTTKSKGQGLGLAVVKRLVEALGGSIEFESDEGKGTKFTVALAQKS